MCKYFLIYSVFLLLAACASSTYSTNSSTSTASPYSKHSSSKHFDSKLSKYTYPFPVNYYTFESQNQKLQMAYMDVNNVMTAKGTMVLLHGKNFPGAYFENIIKSLVSENYRVIIPDQIGFGKSTKPQNYQYSFQSLATNTHGLLSSLSIKSHKLLGHSMGGMLATRYALMYPDNVTQLFLVNPIGLEDWKTMTSYRPIEVLYQSELNTSIEDIKNYQLNSYYDGKWKSEYDKWLEIPTGWRLGKDYSLIAWNAALTTDMIFTQPVFYEFKNIKTPTVLIIGQRDRTAIGKAWAPNQYKEKMGNYPDLGKRTKQLIKNSKLEELKDLGHMPFIEDYPTFWAALKRHLN